MYLNDVKQDYTIVTGSPISASASEQEVTIKIANITADGLPRTLRVKFVGDNCCNKAYSLLATPFSPHISDTLATVSGVTCNKNTYTLTVTFKAENHQNKEATIEFRGEKKTKSSETGEYSVQFENVERTYANKTDDYVLVYFEDATDDCTQRATAHYTEKPQPKLVGITINDDPNPTCSEASYTLTGKLKYVNIDAAPRVWRDSEAPDALTTGFVLGSSDEKEVDFSITMPADGQTHTIHADVDGWASTCAIQKDDYTALWRPEISSIEHKKNKDFVYCKETYTDTVIVTYKRGNGQKILVAYEDEGVPQTPVESAATASGDGTIRIVLTGLHDASAS